MAIGRDSYSKRLIELYVRNKDKVAEKLERKADLLINQGAPLEDYRAYRAMCNDEEWLEERLKIIESRNNVDKRCELLAEEKMYDKLFDTIWEQKDKISDAYVTVPGRGGTGKTVGIGVDRQVSYEESYGEDASGIPETLS